jgi:mRNA turnover protein 4
MPRHDRLANNITNCADKVRIRRIFFGKTKVLANALGTDAAKEYLPGLAELSSHIKGDVGLILTARAPGEVMEYFENYAEADFARAGVVAPSTFTVPEGVVYATGGGIPSSEDAPVPHSVETTLRKWGMPTKLDKGKVMLDSPYTVCKEGQVLNSNQTALLKMFGVVMAEFRIHIVAYWTGADGTVTVVEDQAVE